MWQLSSNGQDKRIYSNSITGGRCSQTMVKVDREGNKWWEFDDLMALPYTRNFAANKITSLFALGLSKDDLSSHINGLKTILKSTDADKYEKAFANLLDFEAKAAAATDAVKQMSSLVCVYYSLNDEYIDSFGNDLQIRKMSILEADIELHAFFLRREIDLTEDYSQRSRLLLGIASPPLTENPVLSP